MKALRWIGERLKDLFYDPTNTKLDTGRVAAWLSIALFVSAVRWNMHLQKPIELDKLATGLTIILGACVVYLIKDRQQAGK